MPGPTAAPSPPPRATGCSGIQATTLPRLLRLASFPKILSSPKPRKDPQWRSWVQPVLKGSPGESVSSRTLCPFCRFLPAFSLVYEHGLWVTQCHPRSPSRAPAHHGRASYSHPSLQGSCPVQEESHRTLLCDSLQPCTVPWEDCEVGGQIGAHSSHLTPTPTQIFTKEAQSTVARGPAGSPCRGR